MDTLIINLNDTDIDVDVLTNNFNNVLYETATEILSKGRTIKQTWMNKSLLELCDKRCTLMKVANSNTSYNLEVIGDIAK